MIRPVSVRRLQTVFLVKCDAGDWWNAQPGAKSSIGRPVVLKRYCGPPLLTRSIHSSSTRSSRNDAVGVVVVDAEGQRDGSVEAVAEADVGEQWLDAGSGDPEAQVVEGTGRSAVAVDAGLEPVDVEPERLEQPREGAVELVAEPAAVIDHDLGDEPVDVDRDRATDVDVEVLERDPVEVGAMERLEAGAGRRRRFVEAEPGEVRLDEVDVGRRGGRPPVDGRLLRVHPRMVRRARYGGRRNVRGRSSGGHRGVGRRSRGDLRPEVMRTDRATLPDGVHRWVRSGATTTADGRSSWSPCARAAGGPFDDPDNTDRVRRKGTRHGCSDGRRTPVWSESTERGEVFQFGFNRFNGGEFTGATFSPDGPAHAGRRPAVTGGLRGRATQGQEPLREEHEGRATLIGPVMQRRNVVR